MINNKYKTSDKSSEIQEITKPTGIGLNSPLTIRLKPETLDPNISKNLDEYTKKLKQDFKESEEDQINTRKQIEKFRAENEVTKEAIGIEAIYQVGFSSYENRILKLNINDCENDICNLEQQKEYLEKIVNEYKNKHGELNKSQLDEFKKVFENALHVDIINHKMMKRLENTRLRAKKGLIQLK